MFYVVKTPAWVRKFYHQYTWKIDTASNELYLTFDDGPHPEATAFVLDQLQVFNAKASFFCIGKNVLAYPDIYRRIIEEGHSTGNHTQHHLDGWKTKDGAYLQDVKDASTVIDSKLFRPPYGHIRNSQAKQIIKAMPGTRVIMWDVLSGDFDTSLSAEKCSKQVISKSGPGSIIVFHDSEKAFPRLVYALPKVLEFFTAKGYRFLHL